MFKGKESGPTVTAVESTSQSNAVSERDAMALLTRFQFPSKRWYVRTCVRASEANHLTDFVLLIPNCVMNITFLSILTYIDMH